jgi:hypothetical protein
MITFPSMGCVSLETTDRKVYGVCLYTVPTVYVA